MFNSGFPIGECDIKSVCISTVYEISEEDALKFVPNCPGNRFLGWYDFALPLITIDDNGDEVSSRYDWKNEVVFPIQSEGNPEIIAHWENEKTPDE